MSTWSFDNLPKDAKSRLLDAVNRGHYWMVRQGKNIFSRTDRYRSNENVPYTGKSPDHTVEPNCPDTMMVDYRFSLGFRQQNGGFPNQVHHPLFTNAFYERFYTRTLAWSELTLDEQYVLAQVHPYTATTIINTYLGQVFGGLQFKNPHEIVCPRIDRRVMRYLISTNKDRARVGILTKMLVQAHQVLGYSLLADTEYERINAMGEHHPRFAKATMNVSLREEFSLINGG